MDLTWTSIAAWLLRAVLGATLLLALTLLTMRCVRQPARRQRLGELGLLSALMLAALCWAPAWLPLWDATPSQNDMVACMLVPEDVVFAEPEAMPALPFRVAPSDKVCAVATAAPDNTNGARGAWLVPALVVAYGLGAAFCLARWLTGVVALWRIVRAARPAAPDLLAALHDRLIGRRRPRLLISTQLRVPVSCGIFRPTVILPVALSAPDQAAQRDWVFAHELAHVQRRDAWSALLFALGQVLYFVLPWYWWLKRQVRLCQEYVADAAAVQRCPADEYAEFLLSLTTSPAAPLAAMGVSGTTSDLYRRVTMLLKNPVRVETNCPRGWTVLAAGVLLGLAVLAAGVGPAQADPPNQKEILEQLDRIQAMVNQLRGQLAEKPKGDAQKATKPHTIEIELQIDGAKFKLDNAKLVEKQRALAQAEQAQTALKFLLAQQKSQEANALVQAEKDRAEAQLARARSYLAHIQAGQNANQEAAQRSAAEKDLKAILELLQKHQADLKDDAARKQVQSAIDRLRDALKTPTPPPVPMTPQPPKVAVPALPPGVPARVPMLLPGGAAQDPAKVRFWTETAAAPHGRLGIRVEVPSAPLAEQLNLPKDRGLVIAEVFENSAAKKAGLKANDILLRINQQAVSSDAEKLLKLVADLKDDAAFDIIVLRRGKEETIKDVKLPAQVRYRVTAVKALGELAGHGAQVTITVRRTGNTVTLHRNEGGMAITVQAEMADGKAKVSSIAIVEKGNTSKYSKADEVPETQRAKVQHLLQLLESVDFHALQQSQSQGSSNPTPATGTIRLHDGALKLFQRSGKGVGADDSVDLYYWIPTAQLQRTPNLNQKNLEIQTITDPTGNVLDYLYRVIPTTPEQKPQP